LNRFIATPGTEDDFVGFFETKCDDIAVRQDVMVDLFSVHENAAAVAAVFEQPAPGVGNDGRVLAGDTRVVELKVILPGSVFAAD
jgi:hypothetical protein